MAGQLATSFEDAWERFQTLRELRLVGETEDWTHGRAQFLTCLVRVGDRSVRQYARDTLGRLAAVPGVEPLPEAYWHITVKQLGFQVIKRTREDDVLRQDVGRLTRDARRALSSRAAYSAQAGPPNAFADVVFLEVHDDGRTRELNEGLAAGLAEVIRYPSDGPRFLPHISIARFTSNAGLAALKPALADLRSGSPGPVFSVSRIDFVKAWLSDEVPELETLATYALAAPPQ